MYRVLLFLEGTEEKGLENPCRVRSAGDPRGRIEEVAWQVALKSRQVASPRVFVNWGNPLRWREWGWG